MFRVAALATSMMYACAVSDTEWTAWKERHSRRYATRGEELRRRALYDAHMDGAARAAVENPHATFGATKFADWGDAEWDSFMGARKEEQLRDSAAEFTPTPTKAWTHAPHFPQPVSANLSDAVVSAAEAGHIDWRMKGAVTVVKNQGHCGGCWAFSAVANMEGQWALAGNKLTQFSEQEIISCSVGFPSPGGITSCAGCGGGWVRSAFDWVLTRAGGIDSEALYPFTGQHGHCNMTKKKMPAAVFSRFEMVPNNESQVLAYMTQNGPLSVTICARSLKWYHSGLLTHCVSGCYDHAVTVVAYGHDTNTSKPYWVIKNSWGTDWGEDGYVRVLYGSNQCGLNQCNAASIKI